MTVSINGDGTISGLVIQRDAFIPPKPFASWVLNNDTCLWDAPVAMPNDDKRYQWDENSQNWVEVTP